MQRKRDEARGIASNKRARHAAAADEDMEQSEDTDVTPWLRALGYPADRVRHAIAKRGAMPEGVTLEERVKAALRYLLPPHRHVAAPAMSG
jgi:Holliday junction resolvasome RuvABC DNA-binding subunit